MRSTYEIERVCMCGETKRTRQIWCDDCFKNKEICSKCKEYKPPSQILCKNCYVNQIK